MKQVIITLAVISTLAVSVLTQRTNDIVVPDKVIARAVLADLSSDVPVSLQWASRFNTFTYAWDFSVNSFAEEWRTNTSIILQNMIIGGKNSLFLNGKCSNFANTNNYSQLVNGLF